MMNVLIIQDSVWRGKKSICTTHCTDCQFIGKLTKIFATQCFEIQNMCQQLLFVWGLNLAYYNLLHGARGMVHPHSVFDNGFHFITCPQVVLEEAERQEEQGAFLCVCYHLFCCLCLGESLKLWDFAKNKQVSEICNVVNTFPSPEMLRPATGIVFS